MASQLRKQTAAITMVPILSHLKRRRIPHRSIKRIERQIKVCERSLNHTIFWEDWKTRERFKQNSVDEEYEIDAKSVKEAANYNALIVGSENYNQQYPQIAYRNLFNIYSKVHRRMQRNEWDFARGVRRDRKFSNINFQTCASFGDQMHFYDYENKNTKKRKKQHKLQPTKLPIIFEQTTLPEPLLSCTDGTDNSDLPFFVSSSSSAAGSGHEVQLLIYRDIASNIKSVHRMKQLLQSFQPDSIVTPYNAHAFNQATRTNSSMVSSCVQHLIPSTRNLHLRAGKYLKFLHGRHSYALSALLTHMDTSPVHVNIIAGGICENYHELMHKYAYLCDLFSLNAIELSPIFPVKIVPKSVRCWTSKLLKPDVRLTTSIRYLTQPYFWPHSCLYGQICNAYLMHSIYGCVQELNARRILVVVDDNNAMDLMVKLRSNEQNGFFYDYSYHELFKEVDDEFITVPTKLPITYMRNSSVKLKEHEWKILHSMFGLEFVKFLEHEIELKQALMTK